LELRLDRFVNSIGEVEAAIDRLPAPFVITARDPREGGAKTSLRLAPPRPAAPVPATRRLC